MKTEPLSTRTTCSNTLAGHLRTVCTKWILPLVLLLAMRATAQVNYAVSGSTAYVTSSPNASGNIIIASTYDGYPVTTIGGGAFAYCFGLTSVTIPNSVTTIGDGAFGSCSSLTNIAVDVANPSYVGAGGVLFNKTLTTLVLCPEGLTGGYEIPNTVTTIGDSSFGGSSLTSVTIPNSVTTIDGYAFVGSSLTSVTIPNSVTNIGGNAFGKCYSLTNVDIGNGVTAIDDLTFAESGLTSVTIPDSVKRIGDAAFLFCTSLTSVTIPDSVISIGGGTFEYCSSLTNIAVDVANPSYAGAGGVLFNKTLTTLIEYPPGLTGSYAIPNSVTTIGDFASCSGLTSVTIPNSVTTIGFAAFHLCTALTDVVIPASVTNIGYYAFEDCSFLTNAFFQGNAPSVDGVAGSADSSVFSGETGTVYYVAGTTGWGSTFGGWPTVALAAPQVGGNIGIHSGNFGFTITGATHQTVVIEACADLVHPVWLPIATNTLANGSSDFSDPKWTNYLSRFYRLRSP